MRVFWVVGLLAVAACEGKRCGASEPVARAPPLPVEPAAPRPAGQLVPALPLREDGFVSYAVYFEARPTKPPTDVLKRLVEGSGFTLLTEAKEAKGASVYGFDPGVTNAPPPDATMLEHFGRGVAPERRAIIAASKAMYALEFRYPSSELPGALKSADALALAFASETDGVLYDAETRELFTLEAFRKLRAPAWTETTPIVRRHVTLHAYQADDGYRIVSLGMSKLGLPDVCVNQLPGDRLGSTGNFLSLLMQGLNDTPTLTEPGRVDVGDVKTTLYVGEQREGDAENRLVELAMTPPVLAALEVSDPIFMAKNNDQALQEASRRAKERVPDLKKRFLSLLRSGAEVRVKSAFVEGDEKEFMWTLVRKWEGTRLTGTLENAPRFVHNVSAGSTVEVNERDLFDYQVDLADGGMEGGETNEVLRGGR